MVSSKTRRQERLPAVFNAPRSAVPPQQVTDLSAATARQLTHVLAADDGEP
jgi:hypothetical protein